MRTARQDTKDLVTIKITAIHEEKGYGWAANLDDGGTSIMISEHHVIAFNLQVGDIVQAKLIMEEGREHPRAISIFSLPVPPEERAVHRLADVPEETEDEALVRGIEAVMDQAKASSMRQPRDSKEEPNALQDFMSKAVEQVPEEELELPAVSDAELATALQGDGGPRSPSDNLPLLNALRTARMYALKAAMGNAAIIDAICEEYGTPPGWYYKHKIKA